MPQPPRPTIPQEQSPLFWKLPLDIRHVIYQQLWMDCGLTQHIFAITDKSYLASFPCILSPEELDQEPGPPAAPDVPDAPDDAAGAEDNAEAEQSQPHDDPGDINSALQELSGSDDPGVAGASLEPPDNTPWCTHFSCFDSRMQKWDWAFMKMYDALYRRSFALDRPDLQDSPILTTFLVCKRMYQEASESLFSTMRFSFSSMMAMGIFLEEVPRALVSRVQFVAITFHVGKLVSRDFSIDSRAPAQEVHDKLRASFPKLRGESTHVESAQNHPRVLSEYLTIVFPSSTELRLTLHPRRSGETIPQKEDLEPLYALARELDSLRKFEVFLPARCEVDSEVGYGEAHVSLREAPFTVKVVPPGWHDGDECLHFDSPSRNFHV